MMKRMIITNYNNRILTCMEEDDSFYEFEFSDEKDSILGNIYIGRIEKKIKNIQAYFVSYAKDQTAFLSEDDCLNPIILSSPSKNSDNLLVEGALVLVQVSKEAIKSKDPTVTTNITLHGKYVIVDLNAGMFRFSAKLSKKERAYFKNRFHLVEHEKYGYIIRTKVRHLKKELYYQINDELSELYYELDSIISRSAALTTHSLVRKAYPKYINKIYNSDLNSLDRIITDNPLIYENLSYYMNENYPEYSNILTLYDDSSYSMKKLYRIEKHLEDATKKNVYLKNGATLYIEQTEALNVIDVNSGKAIKGKVKEDTFLKINLIAAKEIARQIRLRNLSGIIIIDFINMKDEQNIDKLIILLNQLFELDPVKTKFIDITKLGLVEITRKRISPSLKEQLSLCNDALTI